LEREKELRHNRYKDIGRKIAIIISWLCMLPILFLLGYGAYLTHPPHSLLGFITFVVTSILLIVNSAVPVVPSLRRKIEEKLVPHITAKLESVFEEINPVKREEKRKIKIIRAATYSPGVDGKAKKQRDPRLFLATLF